MASILLVELSNSDLVWLAWAAGNAQGQGNADASAGITAILNRIQVVEVGDAENAPDFVVDDEPVEDNIVLAFPEQERTIDPQFVPPTPPPPANNPDDFGAGPPPTSI